MAGLGHGLPSRLRWHHDGCTPDSCRLGARPKSAASGQNEPCHSLRRHDRSTSVSGPTGPAVSVSGSGHKRANQKSLSPQHRGDVCDDAGEPKQNMDANDGKKDRRSGGYREPAMLVIHCSSPASSTSTTNVENIQHRAIRCRLARASGHRPRQQALKFLQVVEFGPNVFKVMRGNLADLTT
jgi:hypothetical protein